MFLMKITPSLNPNQESDLSTSALSTLLLVVPPSHPNVLREAIASLNPNREVLLAQVLLAQSTSST